MSAKTWEQSQTRMTLTTLKRPGVQFIGRAVLHPQEPTNPDFLLALGMDS